jgi:hypothetical protein
VEDFGVFIERSGFRYMHEEINTAFKNLFGDPFTELQLWSVQTAHFQQQRYVLYAP